MRLVVDVDVSGPVDQLREMSRRAGDRQLMTMLARDLEDYERRMFATSGDGSWPPDDADTLEQKSGARTLVDEGRLLRQLTSARVEGDSVVVDQGPLFYARFLRDGDRGMPRRDPAPRPSSRHVDEWARHVLDYIVTGRSR
jgi:hypothetical protein